MDWMNWALQDVLPSGLERCSRYWKEFHCFGLISFRIENWGCIWPRAAWLDLNFGSLSCQHTAEASRCPLPGWAQGWPRAALRPGPDLSLLGIPLVWVPTSLLVRADLPTITQNFLPHQWLKWLTAVLKTPFSGGSCLVPKILFKHPFHQRWCSHRVEDPCFVRSGLPFSSCCIAVPCLRGHC